MSLQSFILRLVSFLRAMTRCFYFTQVEPRPRHPTLQPVRAPGPLPMQVPGPHPLRVVAAAQREPPLPPTSPHQIVLVAEPAAWEQLLTELTLQMPRTLATTLAVLVSCRC